MNKIMTAAGVVVLGTAGLTALQASELSTASSTKPWSVSASLRGFYDDNYTTSPKPLARDSFGFEISPSVGFNTSRESTVLSASYTYGLKYYDDRAQNSADHSHQFNGHLNHAFSNRYKLDLNESFVVAQESTVLDPDGIVTVPLRTDGDNIRNLAAANFTAEITRNFELLFGYSNTFYDYQETGAGRRSAVLDRMEHLFTLNGRYRLLTTTVGILGYQFGATDYNSKDSLDVATPFTGVYWDPSVRDTRTHFAYLGVDHTFTSQLTGSVRVGAQFTDYVNAPAGVGSDEVSPYADASLTWIYNPGSYLQAGIRHTRNATDVAFFGGPLPTLDQETTAIYASLNHRITPKLSGRILGQYQNSSFAGGTADGLTDDYFMAGVNLGYQWNHWLSSELGYNYDRLSSDLGGRSFTRNRVYLGFRAVY